MSGQQIGTIIGGIAGGIIGEGNPAAIQLGMAIGGTIGGIVDPVKGPRIGDGQAQTSTDGTPIAWVLGTATVAGTLVQASTRRSVSHGGKGGPTTYTAAQDFAILICESCSLRNSVISAVIMVEQDGKIVYDIRSPASVSNLRTLPTGYAAARAKAQVGYAKWKAGITFLYGDEAQLPHPTLEAITGIGNTPSYRGSALMVATNFNVSAVGDRIPSYRFTVASVTYAVAPGGFPVVGLEVYG